MTVGVVPLPVPTRPPGEVRRAVHDVLSRAEFQRPGPSALARARSWVFHQLGELVAALVRGGSASLIGWLVVGLLVGAVVLVVLRYGRGLTADPEVAAALRPVAARSATDWRTEAEAHEGRGAWREGLRCRYRALAAELAERGLLEELPGRTTGEARVSVATAAPGVAAEFGGATELFELAWYGNRPTGSDEARRFGRLADRVLAGVGR